MPVWIRTHDHGITRHVLYRFTATTFHLVKREIFLVRGKKKKCLRLIVEGLKLKTGMRIKFLQFLSDNLLNGSPSSKELEEVNGREKVGRLSRLAKNKLFSKNNSKHSKVVASGDFGSKGHRF